MTTEEFITKLSAIGITAKVIDESTCLIFGGRLQEILDDDDIKVYSDAFQVYKEENTWTLRRSGSGQSTIEEQCENLDEAIEKIYKFYGHV
jgi:hypothetical protein